jgi:hypothetical protein
MVAAYPGCDIQLSDNILDLQWLRTLPELARRRLGVKLFYEQSQPQARPDPPVAERGCARDQPGIEA